nr:hypothetical protein [Tanacetum cinerariifolium]
MIRAQVGDLSSHSTKYSSPTLTQKVFANMRRVGKEFFGVDTPLFEGMIVAQQSDECVAEVNVDDVPAAGVADEGAASVNVDDVPAAIDEPSIPTPTPPTQPPPPSQDLPSTSQVQATPPPSLIAQQPSPQQQPQSSQGTEISMDLLHTLLETCTTLTRRVEHLEQDKIAQALEITSLKQRVKKLERMNKLKVSKLRRLKKVETAQRVDTSNDTIIDDVSKQGGIIANIDADEDVTLKDVADIAKKVDVDAEIKESADVQGRQAKSQAQIYQIDLEHADKVLMVTAASATITAADTPIPTAAAPTLTTAPSAARRRKGVVIRDPEETATPSTIIHSEVKSKDKGKGILVEEPKPLKKKEKEYNAVMRYQALKRKPKTEAQAKKNMIIYLRNMVGFKMDYFKGMTYDDIRPIFEKKFNSNVAFLEKTREQMEEEDNKALKRISESQKDKAAKKQKLDEEVEELKRHLQIVPNDEDDVYTEATPLARKVPVVDYEIHTENNKPYYKIIRADGSSQLFLSFLSLLRNFDREDLEVLWQLVKEIFATSKPKNFSDDFLLTTLTYMLEKPDVQAQVWKNQRTVHGLAKRKDIHLQGSLWIKFSTMVGKEFFRVDTPLFEGMIVAQQTDEGVAEVTVDDVPDAGVADEGAASVNVDDVPAAIDEPSIPTPTPPTQPPPPSQDLPSTSQCTEISMDLLHTLLETCTTLTRRVEHLEQDKIAQALEITSLKQRVNKLERRNKLKVSKLRRLKKVETAQRVDTSNDTIIDDVSKQGGIIANIDADDDVTLKDVADIAKKVDVMTEVVTAASATITAADTLIPTAIITAAAPTLTAAPSATKRRKGVLDEEVEELKRHLQIVPNDEDDVYTEATPLARKVPVVDYEIHNENNKPYYKIIRADGSSQLFLSFLSLLRNFDREDLEVLWQLVKEIFASSKPKNFSDDFLLTTLTYMLEKPDVQAQMILLVEQKYPLTRFTLDQILNNVRLEVEEESEVSLELLRFVRQQQEEGFRPE